MISLNMDILWLPISDGTKVHFIISKKHWHHMWNELPAQVWCMIQDAQGWCTGMTQRDGMGREVGGGIQDGEHVHTHGRFMLMYGKTTTTL